jgi:hypothetical protein
MVFGKLRSFVIIEQDKRGHQDSGMADGKNAQLHAQTSRRDNQRRRSPGLPSVDQDSRSVEESFSARIRRHDRELFTPRAEFQFRSLR